MGCCCSVAELCPWMAACQASLSFTVSQSGGYSLVAVLWLLAVAASLVAEHRL